MNRADSRPDSPGRRFVMCGAWLAATILHFLLCAALGYYYGRLVDIDVPQWLRTLDEVLLYSLSVAAEFVVLLVWWGVVGLAAWPFCLAVGQSARILLGEAGAEVTKSSAKLMIPTFAFSLLSLFLFPVVAPRHPESPSGLDIATETTPAGFGYYTVLGLHCLLGLALMFVVLSLIVGWFERKWRAAGWGFLVGLTLGLATAGGFCAGLYPLMEALFARAGMFGSVAAYLTLVAVVTTVPREWMERADRRRRGLSA